jgi:hypothetical protein
MLDHILDKIQGRTHIDTKAVSVDEITRLVQDSTGHVQAKIDSPEFCTKDFIPVGNARVAYELQELFSEEPETDILAELETYKTDDGLFYRAKLAKGKVSHESDGDYVREAIARAKIEFHMMTLD